MDAVDFLKSRKEMCIKSYNKEMQCCWCEAYDENNDYCKISLGIDDMCSDSQYVNAVKIVEDWKSKHPKKTRLQDFLEKFPNVKINDYGFPKDMCCMDLGYCENCAYLGSRESKCHRCWNEQMED